MNGEVERYNEIFRTTQVDDDCCSGSAWLVARDRGNGLEYLGDDWTNFVKDPNRALRLCRRRDAAAVSYAINDGKPIKRSFVEEPTNYHPVHCGTTGGV